MFIECYCFLIRKDLENMGVSQSGEPVRYCFMIDSVEGYREVMNEEGTEPHKEECLVSFRSGDTAVVKISYDDLHRTILIYYGDGEMVHVTSFIK